MCASCEVWFVCEDDCVAGRLWALARALDDVKPGALRQPASPGSLGAFRTAPASIGFCDNVNTNIPYYDAFLELLPVGAHEWKVSALVFVWLSGIGIFTSSAA